MGQRTCLFGVVLVLGCAQGLSADWSPLTGAQEISCNGSPVTGDQELSSDGSPETGAHEMSNDGSPVTATKDITAESTREDLVELVGNFCLAKAVQSRHSRRALQRCFRASMNELDTRCAELLDTQSCRKFSKRLKRTIAKVKHRNTTIKNTGLCKTSSGKVKLYNITRHICCPGGGLWKRKYTNNLCCNGSLYDGSKHTCCKDHLYHGTSSVAPEGRSSCCENGQGMHCPDRLILVNEGYNHSWAKQTPENIETNMKMDDEKGEATTGEDRYIVALIVVLGSVATIVLVLIISICGIPIYKSMPSKRLQDMQSQSDAKPIESQPLEIEQGGFNNQATGSHERQKPELKAEIMSTTSKETVHAMVQTDDRKTINQTDSMGNGFTVHKTFDRNAKTLQLPNSSVRITISDSDVDEEPLECYSSSFYDRAAIYTKLKSVSEEPFRIVSPAVEFFFPKKERLIDYAVIEMPVCAAQMNVLRVDSDPVFANKATFQTVPKYKCIKDVPPRTDCFYIELDAQKIIIYSKVFSWFTCRVCGSNHQVEYIGALYYTLGSVGATKKCHAYLYILDNVFYRFEDYNHRLMDNVSKEAKSTQKTLTLPGNIDGQCSLSGRMLICNRPNIWEHKTDPEQPQTPLFPASQSLSMNDILHCDRTREREGMPRCFEWSLETRSNAYPVPLELVLKVEYLQVATLPRNAPLPTTTFEISEEIPLGQKYEDPFPVTFKAVQPASGQRRGCIPEPEEHVQEVQYPHPELPSSSV